MRVDSWSGDVVIRDREFNALLSQRLEHPRPRSAPNPRSRCPIRQSESIGDLRKMLQVVIDGCEAHSHRLDRRMGSSVRLPRLERPEQIRQAQSLEVALARAGTADDVKVSAEGIDVASVLLQELADLPQPWKGDVVERIGGELDAFGHDT